MVGGVVSRVVGRVVGRVVDWVVDLFSVWVLPHCVLGHMVMSPGLMTGFELLDCWRREWRTAFSVDDKK